MTDDIVKRQLQASLRVREKGPRLPDDRQAVASQGSVKKCLHASFHLESPCAARRHRRHSARVRPLFERDGTGFGVRFGYGFGRDNVMI